MLERQIKNIQKQMESEAPVSKIKKLFENYLLSYMRLKDEKGVEPTATDLNNYSKLFHDYLEYYNKRSMKNA
jgi:hypothetical protein